MPEPPPLPEGMPDGMGFEEMKRWVELAVKQELTGLAGAPPFQWNVTAYQAWLLLQLLQQGYRTLRGDARDLARDLGDTIVDGYLPEGTVLRRFADLGWTDQAVRLSAVDPEPAATPDGVEVPEAYRRAFGLQG